MNTAPTERRERRLFPQEQLVKASTLLVNHQIYRRTIEATMKASPNAAAVCVTAIISQHPNVLPLKREIVLHVLPAVTESLNIMTEIKVEWIVIDLSNATYIDSAGLAALILAMQKVKGLGGRFFLAGLNQTMRSIFKTLRLDQIFQIFPDVDAALAEI